MNTAKRFSSLGNGGGGGEVGMGRFAGSAGVCLAFLGGQQDGYYRGSYYYRAGESGTATDSLTTKN